MVSTSSAPFAVVFDRPEDGQATWTYDPMHFPHVLPRLTQDVIREIMTTSFGLTPRFVNGYLFVKDFAPPPPTAEVIERGAVCIWEEDYVPRIEQFCREIRTGEYGSLTPKQLVEVIADVLKRMGEHFTFTMTVVFPFMGPTLGLVEFAEQVLGDDGPLLVGNLLQSETNETALAGEGLGDLVELALASDSVTEALREGGLNRLADTSDGRHFQERLNAYLQEYGWRVDDWTLLHGPTWAEDPAVPMRMLSLYVSDPTRSPLRSLERSKAQQEAATEEIARRLPVEVRPQFAAMLSEARAHVPMSEGRARWQLTLVGVLRVPLLALGRKLTDAGALDDPNDVFYLSLEELRASAADPVAATKSLVAERKREIEQQRTLTPPPFLGSPPDMAALPPEAVAVFRRFFGLGVSPSEDARVLRGNPGSKGRVEGRARIIRTLSEADRLQPGEILVCTLTAPPWTPLFAIAAGVVTDTGGVLSHSAICAREFAIPCVVGTQTATREIRDGALIAVDGDKGIVELLD